MANYTLLILLVAVTISYSEGKYSWRPRGLDKRDVENVLSDDEIERITKETFAKSILWSARKDERAILINKFGEAMNKKFDTMEEFANHLFKIYKEVTGRDYAIAKPEDFFNAEESNRGVTSH